MANAIEDCTSWTTEQIPNDHHLYLRVLVDHYKDGLFDSIVFSNRGDEASQPGMSTDWCKYGTPRDTQRAGRQQPAEKRYHVISLNVDEIRKIVPNQTVVHEPTCNHSTIPNNRAHANVFGLKSRRELGSEQSNRVKMAFIKAIKKWEIQVPSS